MPYKNTWEQDGVLQEVWGDMALEDLEGMNQEAYRNQNFDQMRYKLVDLLRIKSVDLSAEDVRSIAAVDYAASLSNPRVRVAIVADPKHELMFALSQYYEIVRHQKGWQTCVFATLNEARTWLSGLSNNEV